MEGDAGRPPAPEAQMPTRVGGREPGSRHAALILGLLTVGAVFAAFVVPPGFLPGQYATPYGVLTITASPLFKSDGPNAAWHLDFLQAGAFDLVYRGPKAWISIDCEVWDDGRLVREPKWERLTFDSPFRLSFSMSLRKEAASGEAETYALKGYLVRPVQPGSGTWGGFLFDERIEKPVLGPLDGLQLLGGLNPGTIDVAGEGEHVLYASVISRGPTLLANPGGMPGADARWALFIKVRAGMVESESK